MCVCSCVRRPTDSVLYPCTYVQSYSRRRFIKRGVRGDESDPTTGIVCRVEARLPPPSHHLASHYTYMCIHHLAMYCPFATENGCKLYQPKERQEWGSISRELVRDTMAVMLSTSLFTARTESIEPELGTALQSSRTRPRPVASLGLAHDVCSRCVMPVASSIRIRRGQAEDRGTGAVGEGSLPIHLLDTRGLY